jgi:FADH2 O2-dependent halogenase
MEAVKVEILILGSGFAGSLTALGCRRLGRDVMVLDRAKHPRFAIGESSTPVANRVLHDLAVRYDLPRLLPLVKYGPWRRTYPEIGLGLKRGFSYFEHQSGQAFTPHPDHENELLVAASSDDESSDTQWVRADVDQFLAREAQRDGVPVWEEATIESCEPLLGGGWRLRGRRLSEPFEIETQFLVDGTGEATLLGRQLGIPSTANTLHTRSRSLFSHFRHVASWTQWLSSHDAAIEDHPFNGDDAAQHMLMDGAWMWVLRFDTGVTSVGLAIDEVRHPLDESLSPENEWRQWLRRYPSVGEMLCDAEIVASPGRMVRTGRIQRCMEQAAGNDWVALPHTAGFIDPLHSTGIAHSLCGVERLLAAIGDSWGTGEFPSRLMAYGQTVLREARLIDLLVAGCYRCLGRFQLFVAWSMLYFAAATTYERRRASDGYDPRQEFLNASDAELVGIVALLFDELPRVSTTADDERAFVARVARLLSPYNHVGLFDPAARNMFHHTAAPEL